MELPEEARRALAEAQLREAERIRRYGHVRPPISARHNGETFVAVGPRLFHHPKWKTFHDFLFTYIGAVFEKDWFATELGEPLEKRHPLMQWYQAWFDFWEVHKSDVALGEINKVGSPPAQIPALLSFAYDIYTLEHHSLLPKLLVERLQRKEHFQGARYEAYVAAAMVRAGFTIVLEDEADLSTTHVEFTATYRQTGKQYSVEAKSRHRPGYLGQTGTPKPLDEIEADITSLLVAALRKHANHDRIVFIDINVPPSEAFILETDWFKKIASQVLRLESNPQVKDLPQRSSFSRTFPTTSSRTAIRFMVRRRYSRASRCLSSKWHPAATPRSCNRNFRRFSRYTTRCCATRRFLTTWIDFDRTVLPARHLSGCESR